MERKRFLLIGICFGVFFLGILFLFYGYENTWRLWNIPTMYPPFADFRVITCGAESHALGYDPLVYNPGHPRGTKMNHTRVWQMLYMAGIDQSHTIYFGITFAVLFIISIFLYTPNIVDKFTTVVLMLTVFSPAVLLGVERGNNDLFMFFLLSAAIFLANIRRILSKVIAIVLVSLAFILKLFPIFGFAFILREKREVFVKLCVFVLSVATIYTIVTYGDLALIHQATPKRTVVSYGVNVFWMRVSQYNPTIGSIAKLLSYLAVLIGFILPFSRLCNKNGSSIESVSKSIDAFRVGSGIYIGTFLLGNNWGYRLVFLLFVIPQLVFWMKCSSIYVSWIAKVIIIGILVSVWELVINPGSAVLPVINFWFLLDELANWIVFLGLTYLLFLSGPEWIKRGKGLRGP